MNKRIKGIIGFIGFVLLFAGVVYLKTMRKVNRWEKPKKESAERGKQIMQDRDEQIKKMQEISKQKEEEKRDSTQQIERDKIEEQVKRSKEIIKALDKEIQENK